MLSDPKVKAVLINVFGGITRCDEVAKGVLEAIKGVELKVPVIIRLAGTNAEQGRAMIEGSPLQTAENLEDTAERIVKWVSA